MKKPYLLKMHLQHFSEDTSGVGAETKNLIGKLANDVKTASTELKGFMDQQADEIRKHGETSSQTAEQVKAAEQRMLKFEDDLKGMTSELDEIKKKGGRPDYSGGAVKSIGTQFVTSELFKNSMAAGAKSTPAFDVKSFFQTKDIDSTDANGGLLSSVYRFPEVIAPPNEQLRLRDVMNVQAIQSPSVEYIEETGFINNSATVPEKALKPQSDLTFDQRTAQARVIAHWLPATRQILDDAAQLRNYIDLRLIYGLKITEEAQILYGSGTGEDLLGLMTHTGIQDVGTRATEDVSRIDHIRRAITRSRLAGYPVSAIVLHPSDWETIELSKGTDGHYIFTSVNDGGQMRLFRTPVIESTSMNEGEFLTGSLGYAAQLLDREVANVRVSESHTDYFARNMMAILAEERLAMPIYRPEAIVRGSFAVTPATTA